MSPRQGQRVPTFNLRPDSVQETRRDDGLVYTLPAWTYRSEAFHALEMEHVFLPGWHLVCHVSDLPGPGAYGDIPPLEEYQCQGEGHQTHNY